jgi:hypothetical protein
MRWSVTGEALADAAEALLLLGMGDIDPRVVLLCNVTARGIYEHLC